MEDNKEGRMKIIELTKDYHAEVDDENFETLVRDKWFAQEYYNQVYARRWKKPKTYPRICISMHHQILGIHPNHLTTQGLLVDHIDRNGLNNQKTNLRVTTRSVNAYNSERSDTAVGIYWDDYTNKYKCMLLQPEPKFVGWFHTFDKALEAQIKAANRLSG
jgi:hypothetical protein